MNNSKLNFVKLLVIVGVCSECIAHASSSSTTAQIAKEPVAVTCQGGQEPLTTAETISRGQQEKIRKQIEDIVYFYSNFAHQLTHGVYKVQVEGREVLKLDNPKYALRYIDGKKTHTFRTALECIGEFSTLVSDFMEDDDCMTWLKGQKLGPTFLKAMDNASASLYNLAFRGKFNKERFDLIFVEERYTEGMLNYDYFCRTIANELLESLRNPDSANEKDAFEANSKRLTSTINDSSPALANLSAQEEAHENPENGTGDDSL